MSELSEPPAMGMSGTLPLRLAYEFGIANGLSSEISAIRNMVIEWDTYTSSLRRGYIVELFESNGLLERFVNERWPGGQQPAAITKRSRYLRIKRDYEEFLRKGINEGDNLDVEDEDDDQRFASEADLRDYLAQNLYQIEPGLTLYNGSGRTGVEYSIGNGYIDILAVDRTGRLVVIELKVGRGRNRAVGQLLYYMGWVDANLAKEPCRGIIVAREIPDDLKLAASRVPGVTLYRYRLTVTVEAV